VKRPSALPPLPNLSPLLRAIAGVDEVGRGPLAGPVVAAAVILPSEFDITMLADSKTLSKSRRKQIAGLLRKTSAVGIASIPAAMIDHLNIRQASLMAMRQAVLALPIVPDFAAG
jgi:ribonuclease HII